MVKYILERKNNYYYKRKYPTTQKNFVISLRTDSLREAKFLISIINPKFLNLIMETKMNFDEEKDYIKNIIQEYINEAKDNYEKFAKIRASRYTYKKKNNRTILGSHPEAIKKAVKELGYAIHSPKLEKDKAIEDLTIYSTIKDSYNEALEKLSTDGKERLKDEIIKAEIELLYLDKRNNSERIENPQEYIQFQNKSIEEVKQETRPQEEIKTKNYKEKTIKEIIELFLTKKEQEVVNKDTIRRYIGDFKIFTDLIDKKYLIDLTHSDLDKFIEDIKKVPSYNEYRALFKEKNNNYKLVIEEVKKQGLEPLKPQTIELKLINISALLDLAVNYELLDNNRLTGKFSKSSKIHEVIERIEYPQTELNNLFNSIWYKENLEKNLKEAPHKVWLPLLMLFSGTRVNEASQIYLDQIEIIDNVYFINISKDRKDQKLKNLSSKRKIPIHSYLVEMGFISYIEQLKKQKEERLFPLLYFTKGKGYGQAFSKLYGDFKPTFLSEQIKEQLARKDFMLDVHSFRHSFAGSLKGRIEDGVLDSFMGHRNKSLSQSRYGSYRTDVLKSNIDLCDYPSVDFLPLREKMRKYYKISE
ncbi:site-specific integrase [Aliarcobacter butzleri]|uniref:site-specific integrase n=1 Tax=Aliarcobacter butzleri TaxID=28197 RepID=UPI001260F20C|nr:site-specific integrase [Aliarcobacter butzleri]